jgi:hypothetical protein
LNRLPDRETQTTEGHEHHELQIDFSWYNPKRYDIYHLYLIYCYFIHGEGRLIGIIPVDLKTYKRAKYFYWTYAYLSTFIFTTIPLAMIGRYIMEESDSVENNHFNATSVVAMYIFAATQIESRINEAFAQFITEFVPMEHYQIPLNTIKEIKVLSCVTYIDSFLLLVLPYQTN